jgi:hypothetical protein
MYAEAPSPNANERRHCPRLSRANTNQGRKSCVPMVISERASTHLRQATPSGAAPRQTQQVAVARRQRNRSRRSWPRTPPAGCGPPCRGQPGSGDTLFDLLLALVDLARSEVLVARVHRLEFAAVANPSFVRFNSPTNASMTEQVVVREKSSRHSGIKVTCCRSCPSMNRGMSTPESAPSGTLPRHPRRPQRVFTQPRSEAAITLLLRRWTLSGQIQRRSTTASDWVRSAKFWPPDDAVTES